MPYALVTGASKGIGLAIAEELARKKFDLMLVARSEQQLQAAAERLSSQYGIQATYYALDLAKIGAAQELFDYCQTKRYVIRALINNAGYGLSGLFEAHTLAEHTDMMNVNMITLTQLCYLFLPQLKQQSRAYVLNIGSSAAYQAIPRLSLYAASKSFVLSFSRGLHGELKGTSVSVTCVCPGSTDTDFINRAQVGEKGRKAAEQVNMTPADVAKQAVDAMLAGQVELVTGFVNKVGKLMAWLMPKGIVEQVAGGIYN
jgi:short-subunit dehydrogenase